MNHPAETRKKISRCEESNDVVTAQKMKISIKDFFSNPQKTVDLVTFTE